MKNTTTITAELGKQEYFITREFDASKASVFLAFTETDLLKQWFLPKSLNMEIDYLKSESEGSYKHHHSHPNGMKFGFYGVFHEVTFAERIIKTSEFQGLPTKGLPSLEITTFEEIAPNKTKVVIQTICSSVQFRDAMIGAGMKEALEMSHNQLDELLENH